MTHLTLDQRYRVGVLIDDYNQTEIAEKLGVHRNTIRRELRRNSKKKRRF